MASLRFGASSRPRFALLGARSRAALAFMLLLALALPLAGCKDAADKPLDPVWGKQPCAHCAMLVDEPRFAAQAATADGEHLFFDDVGCLAAWLADHDARGTRSWVRRGGAWVAAGEARFGGGARTPMGYGFVAADDGHSWSEVVRAVAAREVPHAQ